MNRLLVIFCALFTLFIGIFVFYNLLLIYLNGYVVIHEPNVSFLLFELVGVAVSALVGLYAIIRVFHRVE